MSIKDLKIVKFIKTKLGFKELPELQKELADVDFIKKIGPASGIHFKDEKRITTGSGYMACLYVNRYPKDPKTYWLNELCDIENAITVFDIATDDPATVKQNLSNSMEEQSARVTTAKTDSEYIDAATVKNELEKMYVEVSNMGAVMKLLCTRIYIFGDTSEELDVEVKKNIKVLEGYNYRAGIALDEGLADFRSLYIPYYMQQNSLYRRVGQPLLSDTLAAGNPFHFSSLSDPQGFYWGYTFISGGSSVFWDMFYKSRTRLSYNMIAAGLMGSGKSEMLKKLTVDRAIRGDKVRVFDVTGEYKELIEYLGGRVLSLDGGAGGNIINALQILRSAESDAVNYSAHISKVATIFRFLNPEATRNHILVLKRLLRKLYIEAEIVDERAKFIRPLSALSPENFPIWSDLLALARRELAAIEAGSAEVEIVSLEDEEDSEAVKNRSNTKIGLSQRAELLSDLELAIGDICETYGDMFNAHTSVSDVYDEQLLCFDIKNLVSMESEVFDAQIFLTLSMCWDNAVAKGSIMKEAYDKKRIRWEDIQRFLIIIDEAHRLINSNKLTGVKQIETYMREGRKFFAGIALASQAVSDFFPQSANAAAAAEGFAAIQNLFMLSTYKLMLRQDSSALPQIKTAFQGAFTDAELDKIPQLEVGETILSISGEKNINFQIERSEKEAALFNGGA